MEFHRTVTTRTSAADAFAYLADFTTTTEWEPGTVTTTLESGDGAVGTTYRNVSRFLGRETELTYIVVERIDNSLIKLRGHNKTVTVEDTMTFTSLPSGATEVTYRAAFAFRGATKLLTPVLSVALRRLVDSAADALQEVLDKLPA